MSNWVREVLYSIVTIIVSGSRKTGRPERVLLLDIDVIPDYCNAKEYMSKANIREKGSLCNK
jgi:hypothetical protein